MTPLADAARALELVEGQGYSVSKAASVTGLHRTTLADIIDGNYGWEERKQRPVFQQYRQEEKLRLQHAAIELQKKALLRVDQALPKASAQQAAWVFGILVDKEHIMAGEPTQITASYEVHEYRGLDQLAEKLGQALVSKRQETNIVSNEESKV